MTCAVCGSEKVSTGAFCNTCYKRAWRAQNPGRDKISCARWRQKNPKYEVERYLGDPEYARRKYNSYVARNRGAVNDKKAHRRAAKMQRTPAWADQGRIAAFYRLAAAFSKLYTEHHVDHVIPLQGDAVSGLHVPENMQVLYGPDNCRKKNRYVAM